MLVAGCLETKSTLQLQLQRRPFLAILGYFRRSRLGSDLFALSLAQSPVLLDEEVLGLQGSLRPIKGEHGPVWLYWEPLGLGKLV